MIKLFIFAFLYLSDFSYINSLQFIGNGFCASTNGGVFVYEIGEGILASYPFPHVKLAVYDKTSKEIAFITEDNALYIYSTFFNTISKVGIFKNVVQMGLCSGVVHLVYEDGKEDYITKFNQKADKVYIDSTEEVKKVNLPLYLKARVYESSCHVFRDPVSYAKGYNFDFVGTKGNGIYVFQRSTRLLDRTVYINIHPPVYKFIPYYDTLYILHSNGITKVKKDYINSLSLDCFQNGFSPVDLMYNKKEVLLLIKSGFYTLREPYFFVSLPAECSDAISSFNMDNETYIATRYCILKISRDGDVFKVYHTNHDIEYAGSTKNNLYMIIDGALYMMDDTIPEEVIYKKEPIITSYMKGMDDKLFIAAKRGLFVIDGRDISLIRSPHNLFSAKSIAKDRKRVYIAFWDRVVYYDLESGGWFYVNLGNNNIDGITSIGAFENKLYIGYNKGVLIK